MSTHGNDSPSPARALITGANALVSGATGFLGSRLVQHLVQAGFRVRVLVRPGRHSNSQTSSGVELVHGTLEDEDSLKRAVEGQDLVVHTAGKVSDWGQRKEFFRVNLDGSVRLARVCRNTTVRRLIHISSLTVLGLPRDGVVVNEETPTARAPRDPYTASKLAAEQHMCTVHDPRGMGVTIIRPGVIWGKGDITILPRIARLLRQGRMVYIGRAENRLGLSHVDNLCGGIIQAATHPAAAGQIYHLTDGEEISARQAIDTIATAMGVAKPAHSLPFPLVYGTAALLEGAARISGRKTPPMLTRYAVRLVACNNRYDIGKAQREIGYAPRKTFASGIAELDFSAEQT